jgi:PKD domain.
VLNQDTEAVISVAEYAEQPSTAEPVPGASVATAQITVSEGLQQTSGSIIKRIPANRLAEIDADAEDLRIHRLVDGSLEALDTDVLSQANDVVRITATTPGFSFFVTSAVDVPEAEIELTPAEPVVGDEITLDGSGSTDQYGAIVSYQWSLNANGVQERTVTGEQASVVLDESGEYSVELTVENGAGETTTRTTTVTVGRGEPTLTDLSVELGQTTLTAGNSTDIVVTAAFDDSTTQSVTDEATIETDNTTVVTVDGGVLSAEATGSAEITVQFEGESVRQTVTVERPGDEGGDSSSDGSGPGLSIATAVVAILLLTYVSRRRS